MSLALLPFADCSFDRKALPEWFAISAITGSSGSGAIITFRAALRLNSTLANQVMVFKNKFAKWENLRSKGELNFVLVYGVLVWGLSTALEILGCSLGALRMMLG